MSQGRSYRQFCGLARALDHVGDRWTLLVVRELLISPRTFRELEAGLDGISPNLLVDRLRQLREDGLVRRNDAPPRSPTVLFALTDAGAALEPAIVELIRWGARWMTTGPGGDRVDPRWAVLALRALLEGTTSKRAVSGVVHVDVDGVGLAIEVRDGLRRVLAGPQGAPDATCSLTLPDLLAIVSGTRQLDEADARVRGARKLVVAALSLPRATVGS